MLTEGGCKRGELFGQAGRQDRQVSRPMFARSAASKPRAVSLVTRYAAPFGRNVGRPAQAELQHHDHLWKERTAQRGNREKRRRPNSVVAHRKKISSEKETRRGSTGHEKTGCWGQGQTRERR